MLSTPTERVLHLLFHRAPVAIRARRAGLQRRHKYQSMGNTEPPPCFISSAVLACFAWLLCQMCSQATGTPKAEPFVSMDCMLPPRFSLLFGCIINSARWTMQEDKGKKNGPRVIWIKCPGGVSWVLVQTIVFASVRRGKVCQSNNLEVKKSSWSWVEIMHHELSVLSLSGLSQDLAPDLRCNMASVVASWQNGSEQCTEGARISTNNSSSNNNNNNFRNNNNHHHHHVH